MNLTVEYSMFLQRAWERSMSLAITVYIFILNGFIDTQMKKNGENFLQLPSISANVWSEMLGKG